MSDWMGWDGIGLSYTAVTPRAALQSDANNQWQCLSKNIFMFMFMSGPARDTSETVSGSKSNGVPNLKSVIPREAFASK